MLPSATDDKFHARPASASSQRRVTKDASEASCDLTGLRDVGRASEIFNYELPPFVGTVDLSHAVPIPGSVSMDKVFPLPPSRHPDSEDIFEGPWHPPPRRSLPDSLAQVVRDTLQEDFAKLGTQLREDLSGLVSCKAPRTSALCGAAACGLAPEVPTSDVDLGFSTHHIRRFSALEHLHRFCSEDGGIDMGPREAWQTAVATGSEVQVRGRRNGHSVRHSAHSDASIEAAEEDGCRSEDSLKEPGACKEDGGDASGTEPVPRASVRIRPTVVSSAGDALAVRAPHRFSMRASVRASEMPQQVDFRPSALPEPASEFHAWILRVVYSAAFEWVSVIAVMICAVWLGFVVDYTARTAGEENPVFIHYGDLLFLAFFTLEVLCRLCAFRRDFFTMWGRWWNIFDLFLVTIQMVEELLFFFFQMSSSMETLVLRLVRVLRAVRLFRVLRVMRFTEELQVWCGCIAQSLKSFGWASCLLILHIYVASIYLTSAVVAHQEEQDVPSQELLELYGNVPQTALTLFQALSGGMDWKDSMQPIFSELTVANSVLALSWLTWVVLVILNIMTGIFVNTAFGRAEEVRQIVSINTARRFFRRLDEDSSGIINSRELTENLALAEVQDFFRNIDVDPCEASSLFELLDVDGSGEIEFEEFISGCLRLQGSAKAVDILLVSRENRLNFARLSRQIQEAVDILLISRENGLDFAKLSRQIGEIQEALLAKSPEPDAAADVLT